MYNETVTKITVPVAECAESGFAIQNHLSYGISELKLKIV